MGVKKIKARIVEIDEEISTMLMRLHVLTATADNSEAYTATILT
jgi:hypothetical protein